MNIAIHAKLSPWQLKVAPLYQRGLAKHGINAEITSSPKRISDIAIILGPNYYKTIENDGKPYLIGNRKFVGFGDHVHTTNAISWGGFNGYGRFCVKDIDEKRLSKFLDISKMHPQRKGKYNLLCEQYDLGRCTKYRNVNEWYNEVKNNISPLKVRSKKNPEKVGHKTWEQNFCSELKDVKEAHVLNSTVSVDLLYYGIPVKSWDKGDPCYAGTIENREKLFHHLAHCQWTYEEIENGDWWEQLKTNDGPRLHEIEL
ncbi:MAG: hypothetical protein ACPF9R_04380 [Acholeplasmataceae bacterium]